MAAIMRYSIIWFVFNSVSEALPVAAFAALLAASLALASSIYYFNLSAAAWSPAAFYLSISSYRQL